MIKIVNLNKRINQNQVWGRILNQHVTTRNIYKTIKIEEQQVHWRKIWYVDSARPRALFTLWMVCHDRLATT